MLKKWFERHGFWVMNKQKLDNLNALFAQEMKADRIKGASILVEHKSEPVFRNVYGTDKPDSIYKIYSMTKPITTIAVMMLYEQGRIDLYDPIGKYLKAYEQMMVATPAGLVEANSPITLRQLMNMTSGLVYPGTENVPEQMMEEIRIDLLRRAESGENFSNVDICNELAKAPLLFQPGQKWHYGLSADIMAAVVEVVTGIPFGEFLKKELFSPLEMKDTAFYVDESQIGRLATMYSRIDEEGHLCESDEKALNWLNLSRPTKPPYIESGGGGLYSTLEDYSHFVQMLAAGGIYKGKRLVGRKTIEFISKNQLNKEQLESIDFDSIDGYGYGNFMRVMLHPEINASNGSVGEYGWDGLPGTYFMVDPSEDLILVYMQQIEQGADQSLRRKIRQIVYGALD